MTETRGVGEFTGKGSARRVVLARAGALVLRESGIEGLTHRAVAEKAGVPLGSTTYYFASRADLLEASVHYAIDSSARWLRSWTARNADQDIADALASLLHDYLTQRRSVATFDIEIYVLAARRPELRPYTTRWTLSMIDALSEIVSPDVAAQAVVTFNGLLLIGLSTDGLRPFDDAKSAFARAIGAQASRVTQDAPNGALS